MPEHVFTVVAQGLALDTQSNAITLYALIEEIGTPILPVAVPEVNIVTLWQRREGEEGKSFVQRVRVLAPDGAEVAKYESSFDFAKPRHRMLGRIHMAVFDRTGEYRIEVCLKGADESGYRGPAASYPIEVTMRPVESAPNLFAGRTKSTS